MSTPRQYKLAKKISDFIRNKGSLQINFGQMMAEVGYSDSVCKKPHLIIRSKNFQNLLNQELEEELIPMDTMVKLAHIFLINQGANLPAKAKAIDIYYKMTGVYQKHEENKCGRRFQDLTDEELQHAISTGKLPERYQR